MSRPRRVWLGAFIAAATFALLAPGAEAGDLKHHRHPHVYRAAPRVVTGPTHRDDFLDVGAVPDEGSDQRYFSDTKFPRYEVGPTIFQRFESSQNELSSPW